ncbi:MAG: DUF4835 family protein [Bacteroidales bacterium]|jgi:hypothetical protein|nr:DUF4835 family protein [Bacteroidales bacterium]
MLRKIVFFISLFISVSTYSQELRCNIQVVSSQIQGTNKQVFQTLQSELFEFMNNRTWTNHTFANEEKIECTMLINLQEHSGDEFNGSIQIQSRRPIYNSSYSSPLFNYKDDNFKFRYVEYEPLEFNLNEHKSSLTSVLAYYAYIVIGLDYDSFSLYGGEEFFNKAQQIVNNAQNAPEKGWKAYESRKNRYWLIENILNDEYKKLREFSYKYHLHGLDIMNKDVTKGREEIYENLKILQKLYRQKPDPYMFLFNLFVGLKSDEFVNVFSESFQSEADRVYNILTEIDPSRADKYKKIKQQ